MPIDLPALLRDLDPVLKVLGALAAPGGLWFWYDKYKNRVHIKIRQAGFTRGDTPGRGITLVVENIGSTATSTGPKLTIEGRNVKRESFRFDYRLLSDHAKLPPLLISKMTQPTE